MKKALQVTVACLLAASMLGISACSGDKGTPDPTKSTELTGVAAIIAQAEGMTNQELFLKAIEESNGKTLNGIGNSSRGATAATAFIAALQAIDPSYTGKIEWNQPKNNSIFTLLNADVTSATHNYSMTLIQDGNQIQTKMINTGNLLNYIPKDWRDATGVNVVDNGTPLALQTLSKVFMFNNLDSDADYSNVWSFVTEDSAPMFMGVNSEPVGKNFLYMLTEPTYAGYLKAAFDKLPADQQAYFQNTVDEVAGDVSGLGLEGENAKYALAWIKLWVTQYNEKTDDGPICNELVTTSASGQSALIVYSKLRSVEESTTASATNVTIAAYQDGYVGPGGFGYKHYLMIPKTSPLPWTAAAFISFMVTEYDGFAAWGKDIGGYSANPAINQDHSKDGFIDGVNKFPANNDKGYDWWTSATGGRLVLEDPVYAAKVSANLSDWIDVAASS
ncbi:MAG: hypothetical protein LBJ43_01080 [Propionibacteriaceae bacterium]|jgi:hypothetical protein|nr:hypothetical protein [Propionibacteriaceae bacterium]